MRSEYAQPVLKKGLSTLPRKVNFNWLYHFLQQMKND